MRRVTKRWAATIRQVQPGVGARPGAHGCVAVLGDEAEGLVQAELRGGRPTGSSAHSGTSRAKSTRPQASTTAATSARPGPVGTVPPAQVCAASAPTTTTTVAARARART